MADRTVQINSFKYGLDTRREALASLPGTLQTAQNVVIDSGGEIEKRKGFFPVDSAHIKLPSGCFGLQDTDSGLMTFGSATTPAGLPTGVVYQQLAYPTNPAPGAMSSVIFSCSFLGKPFVLATFDNENAVFAYYNGTLVSQITDGIVKPSPGGGGVPETPSNLSTDLAAIVNVIAGWLSDANVTAIAYDGVHDLGYQESALAGATLLMSPAGVHFTPTISHNNSANGTLGFKLIDQNYPGRAATSASVAFQLTGVVTGTVQVSAPEQAGTQLPQFDITNGAVSVTTTLGQGATDIAAAINNNTFVTGYTAIANPMTATVTVYAPTSFGAMTLNLVVTTTGTITTGAGTPGFQFSLTLTPNTLNVIKTSNVPTKVTGAIAASSKGASGVVTFVWSEVNADGTPVTTPSGIAMARITGPTNGFSALLNLNTVKQGYFKCVATDAGGSSGSPSTLIFTVALELDSLN